MSDVVERLTRDLPPDMKLAVCPTSLLREAADEIERLSNALIEIRDHWANDYDHPRKNNEMYRGPYGIGITDGHRACAMIARAALPQEREP